MAKNSSGSETTSEASARNALRESCQRRLVALTSQSGSTRFACLGTVDGRVFAYTSVLPATVPEHRAAITSSLLALAESFAKEALNSRCTYTVVAAEHGAIVTVRIPSRSRSFALSVGADSSEVLALTLRQSLDAASDLAGIIDRA